jgi:hypothetical protein
MVKIVQTKQKCFDMFISVRNQEGVQMFRQEWKYLENKKVSKNIDKSEIKNQIKYSAVPFCVRIHSWIPRTIQDKFSHTNTSKIRESKIFEIRIISNFAHKMRLY